MAILWLPKALFQ